ncbi:MAG: tetratricopeptide repeat protein [Magnetococcus sp. YQC-5]
MDLPLLERFRHLIANYTGLVIPERDDPILRTKLGLRTNTLRFPTMETYLNFMESGAEASRSEWQELIRDLTTVESYFFRDSGQIKLLQEIILPELISRHQTDHTLRIWSAGCASGEEPYSLAILVRQLLPSKMNWRIFILGTDINDVPLRRAQRGSYGQWAFRGVDPELLSLHFTKKGDEWELDPSIRDMVVFRQLNLHGDEFPQFDLYNMDLILCRNVFIYFDRNTIARVVKKMARTLCSGGYLLTGHGEIPHPMTDIIGLGPDRLVARTFPDSLIFHRPLEETQVQKSVQPKVLTEFKKSTLDVTGVGTARKSPIPTPLPKAKPPVQAPSMADTLKQAQLLFEQRGYEQAKRVIHQLTAAEKESCDAQILLARIHANLGENQAAQHCCHAALRINPVAVIPHFLLAQILQELGDKDQAIELLKKVIYLDRGHIPAYLELAALYKRDGDRARARKMRESAMDALRTLSPEMRVDGYEEWTPEELGRHVEILLEE